MKVILTEKKLKLGYVSELNQHVLADSVLMALIRQDCLKTGANHFSVMDIIVGVLRKNEADLDVEE